MQARVRDDAPVRTVLVDVLAENACTGLALRDVEREQIGLPARPTDLLQDLERSVTTRVEVDADAEAGQCEPLRDGAADAPAGSGDEDATTQRWASVATRKLER